MNEKLKHTAALHALAAPAVDAHHPAEHGLKDVRCECCGYMTYHREHMGCIRAAQAKATGQTSEAA